MWASVRRRPCKKLHISGNALVDGHVLPSANVTYDLGSASLRWRDLYLSGTTIDLGGTAISRDAATGGLKVTDPAAGGAPLDLTVKNLVASNVSVIGDYVTLNTVTSNTEQMIITNAGTGPGLKVTQTGNEAIAEFYDDGGVLAMKVADGGNVGIGTTTPRQLLDVQGGNAIVSGNVGIGTTVPLHSLHVGRQAFFNSNVGVGTTAPQASLHVCPNTATAGVIIDQVGTGNLLDIRKSGASTLLVATNGNIGIGTTNPKSKLELFGSGDTLILRNTTDSYQNGTSSIVFKNNHATDQYPLARIQAIDSQTVLNSAFKGDLIFSTGYNTTLSERMRIDSLGNVGIGTTIPTAGLQVNGSMKTLYQEGTNFYNSGGQDWINIGTFEGPADASLGSRLELKLVGNGGYNANTDTGGVSFIYVSINNNGNASVTNANASFINYNYFALVFAVKLVQVTRFAYNVYAQFSSYQSMSVFAFCTRGSKWTTILSSSADPGANSATVQSGTHLASFINGSVGLGKTNPGTQLDLSTDGARKLTTTTWATGSDARVKHDIEDADTSMCYNIVKQVRLKRFAWDSNYYPEVNDRHMLGWLAQDVRKVFPNAVTLSAEHGFEDFHTLDPDQLYKVLYGSVVEIIQENAQFKDQIQQLQTDVRNLKNQVGL